MRQVRGGFREPLRNFGAGEKANTYHQWQEFCVCVACNVVMHTRATICCIENFIPHLVTGYARRQEYYPEQTPFFMEKIAGFSGAFGIKTHFPVYEDLVDETITRHLLEDLVLPSTGGGERKCLFCQTLTTATEKEIGHYLDDMLPLVKKFIEFRQAGRIKEAANCFPPGNAKIIQEKLAAKKSK